MRDFLLAKCDFLQVPKLQGKVLKGAAFLVFALLVCGLCTKTLEKHFICPFLSTKKMFTAYWLPTV